MNKKIDFRKNIDILTSHILILLKKIKKKLYRESTTIAISEMVRDTNLMKSGQKLQTLRKKKITYFSSFHEIENFDFSFY